MCGIIYMNALLFSCKCNRMQLSIFSISLPEKLDYIANKYAEHCHEKWSSEKVSYLHVV